MKIAIGCDHGAYDLKEHLKKHFDEMGIEYIDVGTNSTASVHYPVYAKEVCSRVQSGEVKYGILLCSTGIGMSIAANKVKGIRAAHVTDTFSSRMAMEHNNAHIICIGERITGPDLAIEIVKSYLDATHLGGRHANRVEKAMALENA